MGNFRSDQSAIWNEISAKASRRKAESDSMAMAEIYKKEKLAIDDYLENLFLDIIQLSWKKEIEHTSLDLHYDPSPRYKDFEGDLLNPLINPTDIL